MYGDSKTRGERSQAQLGLSCLYDVLNRMILDSTINPGHYDLREQVLNHLEANQAHCWIFEQSVLVLDRGYPGLSLFLDLQNLGQKFVVRLGRHPFQAGAGPRLATDDQWLNIPIDTSRIRHYRGTPYERPLLLLQSFPSSVCQSPFATDTTECLLTNLDSGECGHMRRFPSSTTADGALRLLLTS